MKLRRILSCLMALLLVCSLPVSVLADTWYLEDGSITVNATESGQTVTQGSTSKDDDAPVITQRDSKTATSNTVTIKAAENATAQVTLDDVNINTGAYGGAAVQTSGKGDVTIELDGENTVQSGYDYAGVDKDNTGALVITNTDEVTEEDPGSLTATGGKCGAGIGGGANIPDASNITITGNAVVTATGGVWGAGIGGGHVSEYNTGDGTNITIEENAHVIASSQGYGAGIGGATYGDGSDITISDNAYVEAVSGRAGAGIGGGCNGDGSDITISDNAQVKAQGGEIYVSYYSNFGAGAAIGDGGEEVRVNGAEATIDTSGLEEGWIAKYENDPQSPNPGIPDLSLEGKEVTSVTFRDENGKLQIAAENIVEIGAKALTCTEDGHEAGFSVDGTVVAVTIPATGHNVPGGYTPLNNATCTTLGTMEGYCTNCKTTVTIPDPNSKLKDHTFTTYVPDPNNLATCTEAGTKTAVCDVCHKATNTVIDPAKDHSMGTPYTTKEPTCQEEGVSRRDCENCDYYETEPIGIVDHSYGDFSSDDNATCTADGTKTRTCIWCGLPHTVPDPGTMLRHQFTNYVSDGNATCTEDGTKTAECDHGCGKTDTVTDEGSALGHSFTNYVSDGNATFTEDGTKTAKCDHEGCGETDTVTDEGSRLPFYLVKGEDGQRIPCQEQKQGGVLTITVDADFAILTGTLGGMRALKGQGVDTIVFVTNGATSTFAIEDLLAQGSAASTYMLTHDGEAVTFTLGDGTDIGKILK